MRVLIFGGEHPAHIQHLRTVLAAFEDAGDEFVFYIAKEKPGPGAFAPRNPLLHRARDFCWDRFGWTPNRFDASRFDWRHHCSTQGEHPCRAIRGELPWRPDVVLIVTPHEGHARYHLVPWARKVGIPVLSIDHGTPTIAWPWLSYRGSMMGCDANAVWSEGCREMNARTGAPRELQIVTGAPSIDGLIQKEGRSARERFDIAETDRLVLLLGTHRPAVKNPSDAVFREVIDAYGDEKGYRIVYKPHPVEVAQNSTIPLPDSVILTTDQSDYLPLVKDADAIVSPATSVIVPAAAHHRAFVNTLQPGCGAAPDADIEELNARLAGAVFSPTELHGVIRGELRPDPAACDAAFAWFGHSKDGRNGARVASLARWIADGQDPRGWRDGG